MDGVSMTSRRKILVIDDEPDVVCYLSTFLEDEGFNVLTARSGSDGLAEARAKVPELITLDITMPGISGIEVLTSLRRDPLLMNIPVIIITGVSGFEKLIDYRKVRPPEGFLQKPIEPETLLEMIFKLLKPEI